MKRRELIKHLEKNGCYLDREGGKHSIYRNPANGRCAAVPRHREIKHRRRAPSANNSVFRRPAIP
jgi:mRNA interferase HicA